MKYQKTTLTLLGFILIFGLALGYGAPAKAAMKTDTVTKPLVYQKSLDIYLGKGGVYFPSSHYTGKAVLTRIEPENTKKLTFTQRWSDIRLFDSGGKEFKPVYGYVYVYFNLSADDRTAWDKGKLSIYHYNATKKVWDECETQLLAGKNAPHGRVRFLLIDEFGLYGVAVKR